MGRPSSKEEGLNHAGQPWENHPQDGITSHRSSNSTTLSTKGMIREQTTHDRGRGCSVLGPAPEETHELEQG